MTNVFIDDSRTERGEGSSSGRPSADERKKALAAKRANLVRAERVSKKEKTEEVAKWQKRMYGELSWTSKVEKQQELSDHFDQNAALQKADTLLQPGGAATLEQARLGPGKEFKQFLVELKFFENCKDDAERKKAAQPLRDAANAYIAHWDGHSDDRKAQKGPAAKKRACDEALASLRLVEMAMDRRELGDPPWDSDQESTALGLKATLDFESLPNARGAAEIVGGDHKNAAFWVNEAKAGGDPARPDKTFIFKPPEPEEQARGYPVGGDIGREALTGRLGDVMRGLTGLELGIPETNIVELDRSNFPEDKLPPGDGSTKSGRIKGSLQQFAATQGELQGLSEADRAKMPQKACEKIVILDMLSLNTDRHSGNMMVGTMAGGEQTLVPIDHGRAFPNEDALEQVVDHLGGRHSAVLSLPGAHEPFSAETVEGLKQLSPDALAAALRNERKTIAKKDPQAGEAISDTAIEWSRRSAKFLRLAVDADPPITAAAAQVALAINAESLFDPALDDAGFDAMARKIIAKAVEKQDSLKAVMTLDKEANEDFIRELNKNGFLNSRQSLGAPKDGNLHLQFPDKLMLAFQAGIKPNPPIAWADRAPYMRGQKPEVYQRYYAETQQRVEQMGGEAALEKALDDLGIVGKRAALAKTDPATALEILTTAAAVNNIESQAKGVDLDRKAAERSLAKLELVAKELEPDDTLLADVTTLKEEFPDQDSIQAKLDLDAKIAEIDRFTAGRYSPLYTKLRNNIRLYKNRIAATKPDALQSLISVEKDCTDALKVLEKSRLPQVKDRYFAVSEQFKSLIKNLS